MAAEGPGLRRPEITLGDIDGTTCSAEFRELVYETLSDFDYDVTVNDPYKGGELVSAWSDPAAGRHSLQIEINRALYMDEVGLKRNSRFKALQENVTQLIGVIANFVRDRTA